MRQNVVLSVLSIGLLLFVLAGCSNGRATGPDKEADNKETTEPVTLKAYSIITFSDEQWENIFVKPIKKKFPNVTLEKYTEKNYRESLVSGYVPDFLLTSYVSIADLIDLKVAADIDGLVKQYKVDLTKLDQSVTDMFKNYPQLKFAGLPMYKNPTVLFYNKDIFDKFGVPYPTDSMTWEQAADMSRKMTVFEGNVQYTGLHPGGLYPLEGQQSLLKVDPKTNKAVLYSEPYQKLFRFLDNLNSIPGMDLSKMNSDTFFKDRSLAMYNYWTTDGIVTLDNAQKAGNPMNWDIATTPQFAEKPGIHSMTDVHVVVLSDLSKHKSLAFQIMAFIATSQDVQSEFAKIGRVPAVRTDDVTKYFGENIAAIKGKNVKAIFNTKLAPRPAPSTYEGLAGKSVNNALSRVYAKQEDINTALRKAEEEANKEIKEASQ